VIYLKVKKLNGNYNKNPFFHPQPVFFMRSIEKKRNFKRISKGNTPSFLKSIPLLD